MRILHLVPLWFPVSQDSHGGIETFLSGLIAALDKLGCRNTLIASGDSSIVGALVSVVPLNLYAQMQAGTAAEYAYYEQHQLLLALELAADYGVMACGTSVVSLAHGALPDKKYARERTRRC